MNDRDPSRRTFMVRTIIGVFAFIGASMTALLGGFGILPVVGKRRPEWSDAGTIADLKVDQPRERRFSETVKSGWRSEKQERSIWIVRKADNRIVAFTSSCPHLGCGHRWSPEQKLFACPCHGSVFDIDGKVLAGPSPRPLDTLATRVQDGRLLVQYEIFKLGVSGKIPA